MNNNSFLWIMVATYMAIFLLVLRYKKETKDAKAFNADMVHTDRYFIRDQNDPISLSRSMFQKDLYDHDVKESEINFLEGIQKAKNSDELLLLLKKRLLEVLKLRQMYETTLASSKKEQYRESSVMHTSIAKLEKHSEEEDLIYYCALLLDDFDKDRSYNYGLSEIQIYETRYIYGSVEAIVKEAINSVAVFQKDFLSRVKEERVKIETQLHTQYTLDQTT